ncbi:hypothetical protein ACQY0O_006303 [Thecaphora frezii]
MLTLAAFTRAAVRPMTVQPNPLPSLRFPQLAATFATKSKAASAITIKSTKASTAAAKKSTKPSKLSNSSDDAANTKPTKKKTEPKLKPWQARGPDGKLLPLPSATKPTLRSSFLVYMSARVPDFKGKPEYSRASAKGEGQVLDIVKASKKIGEDWKALSASEKKKYEDIHEKEKVEYVKALAHWKAGLTPEDIRRQNAYISAQRKKGVKGQALLRDPAKPKRPNSAFFEYLSDLRAKDSSNTSVTELSKKGGEQWNSMTPQQKAPYEQRALGALEQYKKDLEDYNRAKEAQQL